MEALRRADFFFFFKSREVIECAFECLWNWMYAFREKKQIRNEMKKPHVNFPITAVNNVWPHTPDGHNF